MSRKIAPCWACGVAEQESAIAGRLQCPAVVRALRISADSGRAPPDQAGVVGSPLVELGGLAERLRSGLQIRILKPHKHQQNQRIGTGLFKAKTAGQSKNQRGNFERHP
jgi:hypothetical protein